MDDEKSQVFSLDGTLHTSFSKLVGWFKEKKKTIEKQGVKKPWLKTWFHFQFQIQTRF
jgi:hypothetical protein